MLNLCLLLLFLCSMSLDTFCGGKNSKPKAITLRNSSSINSEDAAPMHLDDDSDSFYKINIKKPEKTEIDKFMNKLDELFKSYIDKLAMEQKLNGVLELEHWTLECLIDKDPKIVQRDEYKNFLKDTLSSKPSLVLHNATLIEEFNANIGALLDECQVPHQKYGDLRHRVTSECETNRLNIKASLVAKRISLRRTFSHRQHEQTERRRAESTASFVKGLRKNTKTKSDTKSLSQSK